MAFGKVSNQKDGRGTSRLDMALSTVDSAKFLKVVRYLPGFFWKPPMSLNCPAGIPGKGTYVRGDR